MDRKSRRNASNTRRSITSSITLRKNDTNLHKNTKKGYYDRELSLFLSFPNWSKDGLFELKILNQPEEQHRARYLTEGNRGPVKDIRGIGYPEVKLFGCQQTVNLQIFIGTDHGKIQPHMYYQAVRVAGKSATSCIQWKIEGTSVLETQMTPKNDMTVCCDFIGILKERNVDVEKRFGLLSKEKLSCCKKRSTNCRLVFRAIIPSSCGSVEILQVSSKPILCTQPFGVPEILKTSISECFVEGNVELFIIGKNFLKDTHLIFWEQNEDDETSPVIWEKKIMPEQDYLHHTHLVCTVPPYRLRSIEEPVMVQVFVKSGGKTSDPHFFTYLPYPKELECSYETQGNEYIQGDVTSVLKVNGSNGSDPALVQLPVMSQTTPHQPVPFIPTLILPSYGCQVVSSDINTKLSGGCYVTLPERTNTSSIELILHQKRAQGLLGNSDSFKLHEKEDKNENNFLKKTKKSMRRLKISDNDLKAKRIKTAHSRVVGANQYLEKLSMNCSDSCFESGSVSSGQSECPFEQDLPIHLYQTSDSQSQWSKEKSIEDKAYDVLTRLEFTEVSQKDVATDSCSDQNENSLRQQPQAFLNHFIEESDPLNQWSGVESVESRGDASLHSTVRETSQIGNNGNNWSHKISIGTTELYEPSSSMVCDQQFDYSNNHCSSVENTILHKTGNVVGENKMVELNGRDVSEYFAEQDVSFTKPEVNLTTVLQHDNSVGKSNLKSQLTNKYDPCFTERRETEEQDREPHILKSSQQIENSFSEAFLQNLENCYDNYSQSCNEANTVDSEEKQCFLSFRDENYHSVSSTNFNTISSAGLTENHSKWDSQEKVTSSSMLPTSTTSAVEHQALGLDILANIPFDSYEESQTLQSFEPYDSMSSSFASSGIDPDSPTVISQDISESHTTSCFESKPLVSPSNKPVFLKYTIAPSKNLATTPVIFIHPKNLSETQCESTLFDASASFKSLPSLQVSTSKPETVTSLASDLFNMHSALKSNRSIPLTSDEGSAAQYIASIDNTTESIVCLSQPTGQLNTTCDTRSVKQRLNPKSILPVIINTTLAYTAAVSDISINNNVYGVSVEFPTPLIANHADPSCIMPPVVSDSVNLETEVLQTANQVTDFNCQDEPKCISGFQACTVKQASNQTQVNMQSNKCHLLQNCTHNLLESIMKALKPFDPKVLNVAAELMKLLSASVHRQDNSIAPLQIQNQNNITEVDVTMTQNERNQNNSSEVDVKMVQNIHNQSNYTEVDLTLTQNTYDQNNSKAVNIAVANEELLIDSSLSGQIKGRNLNSSTSFQEAVDQFQLNTTSHTSSCSNGQMELCTFNSVCNTQEEQSTVLSQLVGPKSISKLSLPSDLAEKS
ncbi:uncharacterized protein LOC106468765 isoform X2 [Limulus polyphemus]|nr:uncharacterized protein LOC106468765 isoform X2 [Limulus polyphemus]